MNGREYGEAIEVADNDTRMVEHIQVFTAEAQFTADGSPDADISRRDDCIVIEAKYIPVGEDGGMDYDKDNEVMYLALSGHAWDDLKAGMLPIVEADNQRRDILIDDILADVRKQTQETEEAVKDGVPVDEIPVDLIEKVRADRDRDRAKVDKIRGIKETITDVLGDDMGPESEAALRQVEEQLAKTETLIAIADEVLAMVDRVTGEEAGS